MARSDAGSTSISAKFSSSNHGLLPNHVSLIYRMLYPEICLIPAYRKMFLQVDWYEMKTHATAAILRLPHSRRSNQVRSGIPSQSISIQIRDEAAMRRSTNQDWITRCTVCGEIAHVGSGSHDPRLKHGVHRRHGRQCGSARSAI
jgi:hypothetical protein